MEKGTLRIPYDELKDVLLAALLRVGLEGERAELCARLFAETSRDGVYSHGHLRFPRFIEMVRSGLVDVRAEPIAGLAYGALERWDGRRGPGNLNAWSCMGRAISLSREHGIGCVALAETNHWMRGGSYGWQAVEAGVMGICWTNTLPNLPPWGATTSLLGNNPLVIGVPRTSGHVVLDMAMSQFSYGALESYRLRGEPLPVHGGYDERGELTRDPAAIEASQRALPIGFWKGSGLSLVLDLLAAMLSGGRATHEIPADSLREGGVSQVFIALDPGRVDPNGDRELLADAAIAHLATGGAAVRYPGQRTAETRARNLAEGIPIEGSAWRTLRGLGAG